MTRHPQKTAAVIVAAGRGLRAGGQLPKQWHHIAGKMVAEWTLEAFQAHPEIDEVLLVVSPEDADIHASLQVAKAMGGPSRSASVRNGLEALVGRDFTKVLIHDVARATVSQDCISGVITALDSHQGAAPALAVTDALWKGSDSTVTGTQDRAGLFRAQTPQGFDFEAILSAHRSYKGDAADDVEVARAAGMNIAITPGEDSNLKITTANDFARAERILQDRLDRQQMDIRLGNGFDVHAFEDGDHVILCGVKIPHDRALKGHSDADVGMHAVTDAIYGALAEGDIGRHFPPNEMEWKDADSAIFLKHAVDLAGAKGYAISNIDCTLICERPKIGPHAEAMIARMAELMGLRPDQVSIKATTSERLGFTGREEGIAAIATATLVKS